MAVRLIAGAFLALALSACMSTESVMLDDRTAIISGRGGGPRTSAEVYQASLIEAATQTQARGFELFQIQSSADKTRTQVIASEYNVQAVEKPGLDLVVRMYRAGEISPDAPNVFTASKILAAAPR